jgi:5'-AMP-activated protein kinase catalytic alpha subunit
MIAGKRYHGLMADIWSCGVVLFAMVCGYLPFEDPNTTALYKKIMAGDFSIPKFVSPMAREMLYGLLTTDPERRLKLRDIRAHPWFRMTSDTPIPQSIGLKIGYHSIPVDLNVLEQLK